MTHTWRSGDTLQRIAARWYGDWTLWPAVRDANGLVSAPPASGQRLEIPDLPDRERLHTVVTGDSYESVSLLYYGTEHFAERLRNANPTEHIYDLVGRQIVIPALVNGATVRRLRNAANAV